MDRLINCPHLFQFLYNEIEIPRANTILEINKFINHIMIIIILILKYVVLILNLYTKLDYVFKKNL